MVWAGSGAKGVLITFLVVWGLGLVGQTALKLAGWSWWARIGVLIPVYALGFSLLYRLLNNTIIII